MCRQLNTIYEGWGTHGSVLRPKGLDDISDWASAYGAKPLAPPLPLLEGALVTHAHVAALV